MDALEFARQRPSLVRAKRQSAKNLAGNKLAGDIPLLRRGFSEMSGLGMSNRSTEIDDNGSVRDDSNASVNDPLGSTFNHRRSASIASLFTDDGTPEKKAKVNNEQAFVLLNDDWKQITANEFHSSSIQRRVSRTKANLIQATCNKEHDSNSSTAAKYRKDAIRMKAFETDLDQQAINFYDIVDEQIESNHNLSHSSTEVMISRLVESKQFQRFILFVIILNTITIGLNTSKYIERKHGNTVDIFDNVFLTIFIVEQVLKLKLGIHAFFQDGWNVFDFCLVSMSLAGTIIRDVGTRQTVGGRVLRLLRVMRAFRTLRILGAMRKLQIVVNTFLKSLIDLANIVMLTVIMMFIFAVIGVQLLGEDLPDDFGDLELSMYTLWILITQDGWVIVWRKMEAAAAPSFPILPAIYFGLFIVVGAWIFMNVISGVTVTNWQQYVQASRRLVKEKYRKIPSKRSSISSFVHKEPPNGLLMSDNPHPELAKIRSKIRQGQQPLFLPNLAKIPVNKLENYFMVLCACEQNSQEFKSLKTKLVEQFAQVESSNDLMHDELDHVHFEENEWSDDPGSGSDPGNLRQSSTTHDNGDDFKFDGDVMSSLITLGSRTNGGRSKRNEQQSSCRSSIQSIVHLTSKSSSQSSDEDETSERVEEQQTQLQLERLSSEQVENRFRNQAGTSDAQHLQTMLDEKMRYKALFGRSSTVTSNRFLDTLLDEAAYGGEDQLRAPMPVASRLRRRSTLTSLVRKLTEPKAEDKKSD